MLDEGPYSIEAEAEALLRHAAERGLLSAPGTDGAVVTPLVTALRRRHDDRDGIEARAELVLAYGRLASLTDGVTGRSIFDSQNCKAFLHTLGWTSLGIAVLAVLLEAGRVANPALFGGDKGNAALGALALFSWGALGSCVYLLKTLADKVELATFDTRYLQGWRTRIVLGAILGMLVPHAFGVGPGEALDVQGIVVALLAGLGVKVVYGALESVVEALASRLTLGNLRRAAPAPVPVVAPPPILAAADTPPAAAAAPPARPEIPARISPIAEIQGLLAGLGRFDGAVSGKLDDATLAALRMFLGEDATPEDVRALDPTQVAAWLHNGRAPADWRRAKGERTLAAPRVLSAEEAAANVRMLRHLNGRGVVGAPPEEADTEAVERAVAAGIEKLRAKEPRLRGMSFTQLLKYLDTAR